MFCFAVGKLEALFMILFLYKKDFLECCSIFTGGPIHYFLVQKDFHECCYIIYDFVLVQIVKISLMQFQICSVEAGGPMLLVFSMLDRLVILSLSVCLGIKGLGV